MGGNVLSKGSSEEDLKQTFNVEAVLEHLSTDDFVLVSDEPLFDWKLVGADEACHSVSKGKKGQPLLPIKGSKGKGKKAAAPFGQRFFWKSIPNTENTVFEEISEEKIDVSFMAKMFSTVGEASVSSTPSSGKKVCSGETMSAANGHKGVNTMKPPKLTILENSKAHNLGIIMRSSGISCVEMWQEIADVIDSLDVADARLSADTADHLLNKIWPQMEDPVVLSSLGSLESIDLYRDIEQKLAPLARVERLKQKLEVFVFGFSFQAKQKQIICQIKNYILAIEEVRTSKFLKQVLGTVLRMGNYLNGTGTEKETVRGFQLSSLLKLSTLKPALCSDYREFSGLHCVAINLMQLRNTKERLNLSEVFEYLSMPRSLSKLRDSRMEFEKEVANLEHEMHVLMYANVARDFEENSLMPVSLECVAQVPSSLSVLYDATKNVCDEFHRDFSKLDRKAGNLLEFFGQLDFKEMDEKVEDVFETLWNFMGGLQTAWTEVLSNPKSAKLLTFESCEAISMNRRSDDQKLQKTVSTASASSTASSFCMVDVSDDVKGGKNFKPEARTTPEGFTLNYNMTMRVAEEKPLRIPSRGPCKNYLMRKASGGKRRRTEDDELQNGTDGQKAKIATPEIAEESEMAKVTLEAGKVAEEVEAGKVAEEVEAGKVAEAEKINQATMQVGQDVEAVAEAEKVVEAEAEKVVKNSTAAIPSAAIPSDREAIQTKYEAKKVDDSENQLSWLRMNNGGVATHNTSQVSWLEPQQVSISAKKDSEISVGSGLKFSDDGEEGSTPPPAFASIVLPSLSELNIQCNLTDLAIDRQGAEKLDANLRQTMMKEIEQFHTKKKESEKVTDSSSEETEEAVRDPKKRREKPISRVCNISGVRRPLKKG